MILLENLLKNKIKSGNPVYAINPSFSVFTSNIKKTQMKTQWFYPRGLYIT